MGSQAARGCGVTEHAEFTCKCGRTATWVDLGGGKTDPCPRCGRQYVGHCSHSGMGSVVVEVAPPGGRWAFWRLKPWLCDLVWLACWKTPLARIRALAFWSTQVRNHGMWIRHAHGVCGCKWCLGGAKA